jgi:hypothetical protein
VKLGVVDYDDYLTTAVDQEYGDNTSKRQIPDAVFQAPSLEWGVTPPPDQAYEVVYEYYRVPVDLESATDVPSIPERFVMSSSTVPCIMLTCSAATNKLPTLRRASLKKA